MSKRLPPMNSSKTEKTSAPGSRRKSDSGRDFLQNPEFRRVADPEAPGTRIFSTLKPEFDGRIEQIRTGLQKCVNVMPWLGGTHKQDHGRTTLIINSDTLLSVEDEINSATCSSKAIIVLDDIKVKGSKFGFKLPGKEKMNVVLKSNFKLQQLKESRRSLVHAVHAINQILETCVTTGNQALSMLNLLIEDIERAQSVLMPSYTKDLDEKYMAHAVKDKLFKNQPRDLDFNFYIGGHELIFRASIIHNCERAKCIVQENKCDIKSETFRFGQTISWLVDLDKFYEDMLCTARALRTSLQNGEQLALEEAVEQLHL